MQAADAGLAIARAVVDNGQVDGDEPNIDAETHRRALKELLRWIDPNKYLLNCRLEAAKLLTTKENSVFWILDLDHLFAGVIAAAVKGHQGFDSRGVERGIEIDTFTTTLEVANDLLAKLIRMKRQLREGRYAVVFSSGAGPLIAPLK